jgi:hypothetical protein
MKLKLKKNKYTGGWYTIVNGKQYNITKNSRDGLYSVNMVGGHELTNNAKTRGWAEDAIISSIISWDMDNSWIAYE